MQKLEIKHWTEIPPEEQTMAAVWVRDGFGCNLWTDTPAQAWLDFVHSADERLLVEVGTIELGVEGAHAILNSEGEAFIRAGFRHSVWNRGSTAARWLYGYRQRAPRHRILV